MEKNRLHEIFLQLIKIDALSQHEKPVADYIHGFLRALKLKPRLDASSGKTGSDTGNLICEVGGGGDTMFLAHMDTARSTAAVKPQVLADRIVSDGTSVLGVDNRAGIAMILCALEKALKGKNIANDFTVAFTTCEESSLAGSMNLEVVARIKKCFIFDSSLPPGTFIASSCGAKNFNVVVKGKAAHSGLAPEKGINSIAVVARALSQIQQGRIGAASTVNVGLISGGSAVNVVPEETRLTGEVRSTEMAMIDEIIQEIKSVFAKETSAAGAGLKFSHEWDFKPYRIPAEAEIYREVAAVMAKVGLTPVAVASLAGSDANSLNGRGIAAINLGIGAQNPHANDEFILKADLEKGCAIALELMKKDR
ncbi:MAG: M20/M25/M40 family metallo-hydrolase [Candidatus Aminicenantes bacterium]|nr:M20/M25/M40 family metallo-hydrolase [Candidatus Aminicenantes bacterium]